MTLFKQIAIIFIAIVILILSIVMYQNFNNSKEFVKNELYASASDTATSLGLSINSFLVNKNYTGSTVKNLEDEIGFEQMSEDEEKNALNTKSSTFDKTDIPLIQTMINALFDRGYYKAITLYDMNGKVLISKTQDVVVKGIPTWFIDFVDLHAPAARSNVSGGWQNIGVIEVEKHIGNSLMKLWKMFNDLVKTFYIVSALALAMLFIILQYIFKSLKKVEEQAIAVERNDFIINHDLPRTVEFRQVTVTMNNLIVKVKDIFEKETKHLKQYQDLMYVDDECGLNNRKYLNVKLNDYLSSDSGDSNGAFILVCIDGLENAKNEIGYSEYRDVLAKVSRTFEKFSAKFTGTFPSRMRGADFSLVVPNFSFDILKPDIERLVVSLEEVVGNYKLSPNKISVSAMAYTHEDSLSDLLARADFLLSNAKSRLKTNIEYDSGRFDNTVILGKSAWQQFFNTAFENNKFKIAYQPIYDANLEKIYHEECFIRLEEDGKLLNAGFFMPTAHELGLSTAIEKRAIEIAIEYVLAHKKDISINIGDDFIAQAENLEWLRVLMRKLPLEIRTCLSFESRENHIINNLTLYSNFVQMIGAYGCHFGIDNVIAWDELNYLQEIKPDFLKINTKVLDELNDNNSAAMRSIEIIAKSLDIKIIAVFVEDDKTVKQMHSYGVDGMSGNFIEEARIL